MWKLQPEPEYIKRVDRWPRKHRRELKAMHDNLDTFFGILCKDVPLEQIHFGFIHDEPSGVKAIDQKGAGTGVKQTRLYTYPDTNTEIVHLITVGDKDSQTADIRYATEFVNDLDG